MVLWARRVGLVVLLCAAGCGTIEVRKSTSTLDYLYPEGTPGLPAQDVALQVPVRVALAFLHRVMAALIGLAVFAYAHFLWREKSLAGPLRAASFILIALIVGQITLGAQVIWTGRSIVMTTGHVVFGALTLAVTFTVVFLTRRDTVEGTLS